MWEYLQKNLQHFIDTALVHPRKMLQFGDLAAINHVDTQHLHDLTVRPPSGTWHFSDYALMDP